MAMNPIRVAQNFYDAYDGRRAQMRQDSEDAYTARTRRNDETFREGYADAYGQRDFDRARDIAGKHGNVQGVAAADTAERQYTTQQREDAVRAVLPYYMELEEIGRNPDPARYTDWRNRVVQAASADPTLSQWAQSSLPESYNPQVQGAVQNQIRSMLYRIMSPEDIARLMREPNNQWEGGAGFTHAYRIGPNGEVQQGGALPVRPQQPRAGSFDTLPPGFEIDQ